MRDVGGSSSTPCRSEQGLPWSRRVIGIPLGILLGRVALPAKGLIRIALAAPAFIPPYVMALAWVYLGNGLPFVSRDVASGWTYSLPAAVLVLALVFYPLPMLATEVAIRRVDGRFEEAGLMVARPRRVLFRITLPLSAPVTIAAALLIFVLAISEFGVPGLLRVRVYTTEVFTAFAALYDCRARRRADAARCWHCARSWPRSPQPCSAIGW